MKKNYFLNRGLLTLSMALASVFCIGQTYTFVTAGATGRIGPTQAQVTNTYALTNLNGMVNTTSPTSGIQAWTVPAGVSLVSIEAFGASGGTVSTNGGGLGARMKGEFNLIPGSTIYIVVGQQGLDQQNNNCNGGGGGGGTFVYTNLTTPLIVAGGGGGGHAYLGPGLAGTVTPGGGQSPNVGGAAGANGNGGAAAACGSGWPGAAGAGWLTAGGNGCLWSGLPTQGGQSQPTWLGGLRNTATTQGQQGQDGSFGGGGAAFHGAGGCGGYSGGGGGGSCNANELPLGGGGGSFNSGANQVNASGVNFGHGKVIITALCNINLTAST